MRTPRRAGALLRSRTLVVLGSAALVVSATAVPTPAAGHPAARPHASRATKAGRDDLGDYDTRGAVGSTARVAAARRAAAVAASPAAARLRGSLGGAGVFEVDPTTGTVRILERLRGYLTGPSRRPARSVALSYVRAHHDALGLTGADLATFRFHRDYVDIAGTHHLSWTQESVAGRSSTPGSRPR